MTDWTTARVVRDRDGDLWARNGWYGCWSSVDGDLYFDSDDELEAGCGPLTPILDADGLPVVVVVTETPQETRAER